MRPHRSARWRSSASTRRSTESSCAIAFNVASRSPWSARRPISAAPVSGKRLRAALNTESSTPKRAVASTCQPTCSPGRRSTPPERGTTRSPAPSSSLLTMSSSSTSRATAPLSRPQMRGLAHQARIGRPLAARDLEHPGAQRLHGLEAAIRAHPLAELGIGVEQAHDAAGADRPWRRFGRGVRRMGRDRHGQLQLSDPRQSPPHIGRTAPVCWRSPRPHGARSRVQHTHGCTR